jgi:D-xylose transport system substrate-binding protein
VWAFIAAVVVLLGAVGTAGCGGGGGNEEGGTIALLLPETKTTRYEEQDKPNFERRVHEICKGCEVVYANANQDPAKQQQQAEAAITKGAKVIVISAVDVKSAGAIVKRAKQQNVKVIAYGRLIPNANIDYYVSIDPFKVGQQQARSQMKALAAKGLSHPRIVMINGAPRTPTPSPTRTARPASSSSRERRSSRAMTRPTGAPTRPSRRWSSRSPRWARTASTPCTSPTTAWRAGRSPRSRAPESPRAAAR